MRGTVAVVDVGSNSIKLLVAESGDAACPIRPVFAETIETRISAGISRDEPYLPEEAMSEGVAAIVDLLSLANSFRPAAMALVATSAVRDALNRDDFGRRVEAACGHALRILSGSEEAQLIGLGLGCDPLMKGVPSFVQCDLGGGSLELIRFEAGAIVQALSLQLGAVRLCERFVADPKAPLSRETATALHRYVREQVEKCRFDLGAVSCPLIATGGAFTVSRAILAARTGRTIETASPVLKRTTLAALSRELAALPWHERLAIPHLPASRADIFPTALVTIDALFACANRSQLSHSFYNLRHGIALNLLRGQ